MRRFFTWIKNVPIENKLFFGLGALAISFCCPAIPVVGCYITISIWVIAFVSAIISI